MYLWTSDGVVVQKKMTETREDGPGPDPEMYTHLTDHVFQMILATAPTGDDCEEKKPSKLKEVRIFMYCLYRYS